jgi:hypothetical protein
MCLRKSYQVAVSDVGVAGIGLSTYRPQYTTVAGLAPQPIPAGLATG